MLGACLGPSRGAPLWFRPGIVGPRFPGPLPVWLPLLRLGGGRLCWCLEGGPPVGGGGCRGLDMPTKWCSLVGCCGAGFGSGLAGWIGRF